MKLWKGIIIYAAALVLQPFINYLTPHTGFTANLILVLTVIITFIYDDDEMIGIGLGTVFGLLSDMAFGQYIGPGAFSMAITGITVLFLKGFANRDNFVNGIVLTLISTWLYSSVYWLIYFMAKSPYSYVYAMKTIPLQMVFNCIIGLILYLVLIKKTAKYRKDRYIR